MLNLGVKYFLIELIPALEEGRQWKHFPDSSPPLYQPENKPVNKNKIWLELFWTISYKIIVELCADPNSPVQSFDLLIYFSVLLM